MKCTETLTTATVEVCPERDDRDCVTEEDAVCDGHVHVTLHTLTCWHEANPRHLIHAASETTWSDYTPGATPHRESLVSDAELEVARTAFCLEGTWQEGVVAALEAAARVRQEDDR